MLLLNLGTPSAPTASALRRYLREFLSDPRVVELPRALWLPILYGFILPFRPARSAKLYARIWQPEGSPLLVNSVALRDSVAHALGERIANCEVAVALGMNYGEPSVKTALDALRDQGASRIIVLPLFPQYAGSTTGAAFDALSKALTKWRWVPELRFVAGYHDHSGYVAAVAQSIRQHWHSNGRAEHLLFSFHGVPQRYLLAGDPYHCHCHATARLVAQSLELEQNNWSISFQSRFGKAQWLRPYTDELLPQLVERGVQQVDVVCPGFAVDCVETLEEIAIEGQEIFTGAGGEKLNYISALNHSDAHVQFLVEYVLEQTSDWLSWAELEKVDDGRLQARSERAKALGAQQ